MFAALDAYYAFWHYVSGAGMTMAIAQPQILPEAFPEIRDRDPVTLLKAVESRLLNWNARLDALFSAEWGNTQDRWDRFYALGGILHGLSCDAFSVVVVSSIFFKYNLRDLRRNIGKSDSPDE
jgi:hypothetical protein